MFQRLAFVVFGLALPLAASAQYSIDWYTIDGGGGTSTGGPYSLSGTIGQPDADVVFLCSGMSCIGATYELTGGFWAGIQSAPSGPGAGCNGALNCIFRDGYEG